MQLTYTIKSDENVVEFAHSIIIPGYHLSFINITYPITFNLMFLTVYLHFSYKKPEKIRINKIQDFSDKQIESFENLPQEYGLFEGITSLVCKRCNLKNLKGIPSTVTSLTCSENYQLSLKGIKKLKNLKILFCARCNLKNLENLPQTLEMLSCGNNLITKLPETLPNLKDFVCSFNRISVLPNYPKLECINCDSTNLSNFKGLPKTIKRVRAYDVTQMESLEGLSLELDVSVKLSHIATEQLKSLRLMEFNRKRHCLGLEDVEKLPNIDSMEYEDFMREYTCWLYQAGNEKGLEAQEELKKLLETV